MDNAKSSEGATKDVLKDVQEGTQDTMYGPWVVVGRKKNGTKTQRNGGTPPRIANYYLRQMQGNCGNGVKANIGLGKAKPTNWLGRDAKRKLSPPRVINGAQLMSSLQTIQTNTHAQAQTPTESSLNSYGIKPKDVRQR